jgi:hypothetical protein
MYIVEGNKHKAAHVLTNTGGEGAMKTFRRFWTCMFLLAVTFVFACATSSQAQSVQAQAGGEWRGLWTAPPGWSYEAKMSLRIGEAGSVNGEITWTLRRSPRTNDQAKLGLTGVELVRGTYHAVSRALILDGYDKRDPQGILGLDKYRLVVSDNYKAAGGITAHHDKWDAQIFLSR